MYKEFYALSDISELPAKREVMHNTQQQLELCEQTLRYFCLHEEEEEEAFREKN